MCLLGATTVGTIAATDPTAATNQVQHLQQRIQLLERELRTINIELQSHLHTTRREQLETDLKQLNTELQQHLAVSAERGQTQKKIQSEINKLDQAIRAGAEAKLENQLQSLKQEFQTHLRSIHDVGNKEQYGNYNSLHGQNSDPNLTPDWIFLRGTPVTSSPYVGIFSEFYGNDLIVNFSSIEEDVRLLKARQRQQEFLYKNNLPFAQHPVIIMSGKIEAITWTQRPYVGANLSDIDVATGQLDFVIEMNPWVTGFLGLDYDNTPPTSNISNRRISNSRLFLNKGFVTVGRLNKFPLWLTFGQFFVPFGKYSSSMVTSPVTLFLGRTCDRAILFGYQQSTPSSPYAEVFTYASNAKSITRGTINRFGANGGYYYQNNGVTVDAGVSYISDLSDSDGIQGTGDNAFFPGFSIPTAAGLNRESLAHAVPGINQHTAISFGSWNFIGELVLALRPYDPTNLSFNGNGAKPSAFNIEGIYNFNFLDKPINIGLSYQQTNQALALNLPKQRYSAVVNYAAWRDTILSLEYRHEINYRLADSSDGTFVGVAPNNAATDPRLGKSQDILTLQLGIYF